MLVFPKKAFKSLLRSFQYHESTVRDSRKFILFLGPPGCGLGTYATLLCKDLKFNRISISEEIRKLVQQRKSKMKIDAKILKENLPVLTQGKIVTNDLAIEIITQKLKSPFSKSGVTIGGFPRNLSQAECYEKTFPIDLVVYLRVDEDILMETLLGRRSCYKCGIVYNLCEIHRNNYELDKILPQNEGRCDSCNEKLSIRPDDNIETIYSRIYNYRNEGLKVLEYFKRKGLVFEYEPKKGIKDYKPFFEKVVTLLEKK